MASVNSGKQAENNQEKDDFIKKITVRLTVDPVFQQVDFDTFCEGHVAAKKLRDQVRLVKGTHELFRILPTFELEKSDNVSYTYTARFLPQVAPSYLASLYLADVYSGLQTTWTRTVAAAKPYSVQRWFQTLGTASDSKWDQLANAIDSKADPDQLFTALNKLAFIIHERNKSVHLQTPSKLALTLALKHFGIGQDDMTILLKLRDIA